MINIGGIDCFGVARSKLSMENLMRKMIAIAFASSLGLCTVPAMAMPVVTLDGGSNALITHVAQGCGPGMHRGPAGACRPLYTCPRGWHTGPYGKRCVRNH